MPAPGVQNVFTVYSTTAKNKGCYELSLIANHSQLSLRGMNGNDVVYDIIIYRQNIDLLATYGLIPKFDIGLALPFVVNQSGGSHQTKFGGFNTEFIKAKSFAFGDMRIIPKYTLLDNSKGGFGLGLLGQFTIPTGSNDAFFGNGQIGFEFRAAADFKHKDKLFAANIGYYICEGKDALNIHLGREFRYGIGLLYPTGQNNRLVLISEIFGAVDPPAEDRSWSSRNFPTEFLGLARYFFSSRIFGSIGGAIGLTDGVGTPQFRVIGMVGYSFEDTTEKKQVIFSSPTPELFPSPVKPPPLILTATEPNNGAKDVKRETPLILHFSENVNNASVHGSVIVKDISGTSQVITTEIEVKGNIVIVRPSSPEVWKEGAKIEATLTQGIVSSVANESGGQLKDAPIVIKFDVVLPPPPVVPKPVVDKVLATPVAPKHIVDKVLINETSIIISEPIFFETGKANILPSSYNILNKLSQAIKENSNILLVEVAGHSDNIGTDKKNLALSRSRADAVVKYLVRTGVDASRLIATGYSHCLPIGTNKTKEGRAKNRRVEFKILKKANPTSSPK
jgi:outer membrane protein OmpA-like peptidoglycan-associated protein